MASINVETRDTVGVTADMIEKQHIEQEEDADAGHYLEGVSLASLVMANAAISFVLALDKTILGSKFFLLFFLLPRNDN